MSQILTADGEKFPLETNECFIKAIRVPRQKTLLTVSLNPCSVRRGEPSSVTMQLWNLETRKPFWSQNGVLLGKSDDIGGESFDIIFSQVRKKFYNNVSDRQFCLRTNLNASEVFSKTLQNLGNRHWKTVRRILNPIIADIEAASFNGDESQLLTLLT